MMNTVDSNLADSDLWASAIQDDQSSFEELVRRHQSAVCAVAYNASGNLSLSEDIAQETFWIAWRDRSSLIDPTRLRAWLCGIARNLARNSRRKSPKATTSLEESPEPAVTTPEPCEEAVSREEEHLVWNALEQIPEMYRETLILFYREDQSVAEVATTLELSPDAVKQRLSRGRGFLRDQVAQMIEGTLGRTAPRGRFTIAVMAGLTSASVVTKTALAGGTTIAASTGATKTVLLSSAGAAGAAGGLLGVAGGLFGGWLGTWIPAQFAATNREREVYLSAGRRMLIVSLIFSAVLIGLIFAVVRRDPSTWTTVAIVIGWLLLLNLYIGVEIACLISAVRRIRRETPAESDPNHSWLKAYVSERVVRWEGRVYRSKATLLGWPLVDIQVSNPRMNGEPGPQKQARGWIAIGDRADGILLAIGGVARGGIAIGGFAIGLFAQGGLSLGIISIGGLSLGLVSIGGLALGGIAFGGLGLGWQAAGGCAIAWNVACGGCAVAYHAADGGAAMAHDYAAGGAASALHANDDAAKAILETYWIARSMNWYEKNSAWTQFVLIAVCVLPSLIGQLLMYKKKSQTSGQINGDDPVARTRSSV